MPSDEEEPPCPVTFNQSINELTKLLMIRPTRRPSPLRPTYPPFSDRQRARNRRTSEGLLRDPRSRLATVRGEAGGAGATA